MNTNATAITAALMPESDARILRMVLFTCALGFIGSAYSSLYRQQEATRKYSGLDQHT